MSEFRECPFCGSHNEKPINHAEDCFIRMYAENVDEYYYSETLVHDRESMKEAWNTRAERTCEMELQSCVDAEGNVFSFVCSECGVDAYGHVDIGYCPNCGAKVVEP